MIWWIYLAGGVVLSLLSFWCAFALAKYGPMIGPFLLSGLIMLNSSVMMISCEGDSGYDTPGYLFGVAAFMSFVNLILTGLESMSNS